MPVGQKRHSCGSLSYVLIRNVAALIILQFLFMIKLDSNINFNDLPLLNISIIKVKEQFFFITKFYCNYFDRGIYLQN